MRKIVCVAVSCIMVVLSFCVNSGAIDVDESASVISGAESAIGVFASGAFNMSVAPYGRSQANTTFPLEAGETVGISAVYSPSDASMDFGLIDSNGVFHYFTVAGGSVERTLRISESGHYTLAVRNNSGNTVRISGFVNY